ncbi:hypothetical protein C2845_PM18G05840 [Panicum miliaceum]|uniref:Uncharacterized protein n=1 Tax=Panicum miliaceum TaxID=4540 RepID=A0A3L6PG49_PANMI|nr:hypothetical protein C2845_PM18G05840 [Panicum miliaceum]
MLIEFKNTRQCKVAVFGRYGVQKYPPLEAEHVQKLLHPRNSGKAAEMAFFITATAQNPPKPFFHADHSWPEVYSPETAIKVGPCTKPSPPATIGEQSPPSALSCY